MERHEEARCEALRATVLQEAPYPIGVAGSDKVKHEVAPLLNGSAETVDVMGISTAVSFWHKYQQEFHDLQRDTAISDLEDGIMDDEPRDCDDEHSLKAARLSAGSSMSMNSSRSSSPLDGSPAPDFQR